MHCLATISDEEFSRGTEVLLSSFLKYNPWFEGDIVVLLGGDLSSESRRRLGAIHSVSFQEPGAELRSRAAAVVRAVPGLGRAESRFYSLEVFALGGYDRVVFVDSDAFVVGDVAELFTRDEPLLACPDGSTYEELFDDVLGSTRDVLAFNLRRYGRALSHTFNAGVLSIGPELLTESVYREVLSQVDPDSWREVSLPGWADQLVLNVHFGGRATLLDGSYNYMPLLEPFLREQGIGFMDARIIHMAGRIKPWRDLDHAELARTGPTLFKYLDVWRDLYAQAQGRPSAERLAQRLREGIEWMERFVAYSSS